MSSLRRSLVHAQFLSGSTCFWHCSIYICMYIHYTHYTPLHLCRPTSWCLIKEKEKTQLQWLYFLCSCISLSGDWCDYGILWMASNVRFTQSLRFSFPDSEKISPPVAFQAQSTHHTLWSHRDSHCMGFFWVKCLRSWHSTTFLFHILARKRQGASHCRVPQGTANTMTQVPPDNSRCWPYMLQNLQASFTLWNL